MDNKKIAKKYILKNAKVKFPAQELWIDNNLNFFAFDKYTNELIISEGKFNINNKNLEFTTKNQYTINIENTLNNYLNEKLNEGYECFASELFV